jgi:hypothetical protein
MGNRSMLSDGIVDSLSGLEHLCRGKRWLVNQPVWNAPPPLCLVDHPVRKVGKPGSLLATLFLTLYILLYSPSLRTLFVGIVAQPKNCFAS